MIDSAAIHAYEKKQAKRKSEVTGNANWGAKFDSFGNKMKWFGYNIHLAVDTKSDLRRYSSPHRDTKRWKELYNERTSVERCNSRLKTYLTADALYVWGIQKVTTHQYLNAIVLLASAIAMFRQSNRAAA